MAETWPDGIPKLYLAGGPEHDSRLHPNSRHRKEVLGPGGTRWERVYCANCGDPCGAVLADAVPWVIAVCNQCEAYGQLPLPEVPPCAVKEV